MVDPLEVKSTGQIADELTISVIKAENGIDTADRVIRLKVVLNERVKDLTGLKDFADLLALLENVNRDCWDAQDVIMAASDYTTVAIHAKKAQQLNARRNRLIRDIDTLMNELDRSYLEKNYAE